MAWTCSVDKLAFLGIIGERADAVNASLKSLKTDNDDVRNLKAEMDEINLFVQYIRDVQAMENPLDHLRAVPELSGEGDVFVLRVGDWKAYYHANTATHSLFGALVIYGDDPTDLLARLAELQPEHWKT